MTESCRETACVASAGLTCSPSDPNQCQHAMCTSQEEMRQESKGGK